MKGHWTKNALQSGDTFPGSGGRKVFSYGLNGAREFRTPNSGSTYDGTPTQIAPDPDIWQTITFGNFVMTPGHWLRVRCMYLPSGPTQGGPNPMNFDYSGSEGGVRAQLQFSNEGIDLTQQVVSFDIPGISQASGNLPNGTGASFPRIKHVLIQDVYPLEVANNISNIATFSELTRCDVNLQYRGGVRIIDYSITEIPRQYGFEHTSGSLLSGAVDVSYPVYEVDGEVPQKIVTPFPQTDGIDGDFFTEPRFGTHLTVDATKNQIERLGPIIANWSSAAETTFAPGDTNIEAMVITSSTPQNLLDVTGSNAWHVTGSGWAVPSQYALSHHNNDPKMILRGRAAQMPCCFRVKANVTSGDTGIIRFQSSARSYFEMKITNNLAAYTTNDGFLEGARAGDDDTGTMQIFAHAHDGMGGVGTLNIQSVQVTWFSGVVRKEAQI